MLVFYLYQISKDNKYLDTIVKYQKKKNLQILSEHSKRMLADTYIILKSMKMPYPYWKQWIMVMDLKKH